MEVAELVDKGPGSDPHHEANQGCDLRDTSMTYEMFWIASPYNFRWWWGGGGGLGALVSAIANHECELKVYMGEEAPTS